MSYLYCHDKLMQQTSSNQKFISFFQSCHIQILEWILEDTYSISNEKDGYGIISVSFGKLKCLSCRVTCSHARNAETSLTNMDADEQLLFPLFEKLSRCNGHDESPYMMKVWSTCNVPFYLPAALKAKIVQNPRDIFITEDGIMQAIPTNSDSCTNCGGRWSAECFPMAHTSHLFTRFHQYDVQCKKWQYITIQLYDLIP